MVLAGSGDRYAEASHWGELAWGIVQRIGAEQGALAGSIYVARSLIAQRLSHYTEARALGLEALHRFEKQYGGSDQRLVRPGARRLARQRPRAPQLPRALRGAAGLRPRR